MSALPSDILDVVREYVRDGQLVKAIDAPAISLFLAAAPRIRWSLDIDSSVRAFPYYAASQIDRFFAASPFVSEPDHLETFRLLTRLLLKAEGINGPNVKVLLLHEMRWRLYQDLDLYPSADLRPYRRELSTFRPSGGAAPEKVAELEREIKESLQILQAAQQGTLKTHLMTVIPFPICSGARTIKTSWGSRPVRVGLSPTFTNAIGMLTAPSGHVLTADRPTRHITGSTEIELTFEGLVDTERACLSGSSR